MTKIELLTGYYEKEMNNVFSYSANWLMTIPKKGYEKEWAEAKERSELLDQMIQEEQDSLEIKRTAEAATPDGSKNN